MGDATVRYETTVSGGQVTAFREFVHVPESWQRDYARLRSKNETAGAVATLGLFLTALAMIVVLVRKIVLQGRAAGASSRRFGARRRSFWRSSRPFNGIPLTLYEYDTASSLSSHLTGADRARHPRRDRRCGAGSRSSSRRPSRSIASGSARSSRSRDSSRRAASGRSASFGRAARLRARRLLLRVPGGLLRRRRAVRRLGAGRRSLQRHAEHGVPVGDGASDRISSGRVRGGHQPDVLDLVPRPARRGPVRRGRPSRVHLGLRSLRVSEPALLHPRHRGRDAPASSSAR